MEKKYGDRLSFWVLISLLPFIYASSYGLDIAQHEVHFFDIESIKDLNIINRPFVVSHNLSDGSIVDCVRIEDQLTLQHPLLKNHVVQEPPSPIPNIDSSHLDNIAIYTKFQRFHHEVGSCSYGTIPIQRATQYDIQRNDDLRKYKKAEMEQKSTGTIAGDFDVKRNNEVARVTQTGSFHGGSSRISLWGPISATGGYSLSQIWVSSEQGSSADSAEVGWMVYEDRPATLMIYWTRDKYQTTGCLNLMCTGFIQVDKSIVLGATIEGTFGSSKLYQISRVNKNADWWLRIEDVPIGYWPSEIFSYLYMRDGLANTLKWGGITYYSDQNTPNGEMGNGMFGSKGPDHPITTETNYPAHHALLTYLVQSADPKDFTLVPCEADEIRSEAPHAVLYDISHFSHAPSVPGIAGGTWVFFGGPGLIK